MADEMGVPGLRYGRDRAAPGRRGLNAGPDQVLRAVLPPAERLVNLTPHEIVLQAIGLPGPDAAATSGTSQATVRLAPEGQFARVDDEASRLGQGWLNSGTGLIALTRLRRSGKLTDLPPPAAGTRLVVSRVTALAARHRADLVFPLGEQRDAAGQITSVRRLAAFRPRWAAVRRVRTVDQAGGHRC